MFTQVVFWVLINSLPSRALRRFYRSVRRKISFRARGPENEILHVDPIFLKNENFPAIFDGTKNVGPKRALTWGTSSVNTPKTTSYVFGSWRMNRQIDHYKSKYVVYFYPWSRLPFDSA